MKYNRLMVRFLVAGAVWSATFFSQRLIAAEWQWSVPVPTLADRTNETPRAYLWIPPKCERVRGVVFGQHNMEEEGILEHPIFRKTLADLGFAEVWVAPGFDAAFRFDLGAGERFDTMMKALAESSGYGELTNSPLVPVGHSAAASLPWIMAAWKPERVLAGVSFSGQYPYIWDGTNVPQVVGRSLDSVPGIVTGGEYEWADETLPGGLKIRAEHPQLPLSAVGCPADGHFEATDEKVELLSLYVKKAVQFRLPKASPANGPAQLNPIDPTKSGWLVERYATDKNPSAPSAPVGQYRGDPAQAFWYFDAELAHAVEAFQQKHRGKAALLGYVQEGQIVPQKNGTHQQVTLKYLPQDDGVTFKLTGAFLDTVPDGRPARWAHKKAGDPIEKPPGGPPIAIQRITGPIKKISDDTWQLAFNRASYLGDRRGNEAWLVAIWPGDGTFKRAVQQSMLAIPRRNSAGAPQRISFAAPASIPFGTKEIKLAATANSGLPVRFYVREGPAEVDGDKLKLTAIPRRAKLPIAVTVVAWQFGRATEPKIQSAEPVIQTMLIRE